jgi:hypothetical protein
LGVDAPGGQLLLQLGLQDKRPWTWSADGIAQHTAQHTTAAPERQGAVFLTWLTGLQLVEPGRLMKLLLLLSRSVRLSSSR